MGLATFGSYVGRFSRTSPIRVLECVSMLLLRLCAKVLCVGLVDDPAPFTDPSALLLRPVAVGDVCDMGVAVV